MRKIAISSVVLAALVGPAHAEDQKPEDNPMLQNYLNKQKENAEIDKQYQKTLEQTRGANAAPVKIDPWANMRGTDASKPKH
jgi:hypothetical protein